MTKTETPATSPAGSATLSADDMAVKIGNAQTVETLGLLGAEVARAGYSADDLESLRRVYASRKNYLSRDRLDDVSGKVVTVLAAEPVPTQYGIGVSLHLRTAEGKELKPFSSAVRVVRKMTKLAQSNAFPAQVEFKKVPHETKDGVNGTIWEVRIVSLPNTDNAAAWDQQEIPF